MAHVATKTNGTSHVPGNSYLAIEKFVEPRDVANHRLLTFGDASVGCDTTWPPYQMVSMTSAIGGRRRKLQATPGARNIGRQRSQVASAV